MFLQNLKSVSFRNKNVLKGIIIFLFYLSEALRNSFVLFKIIWFFRTLFKKLVHLLAIQFILKEIIMGLAMSSVTVLFFSLFVSLSLCISLSLSLLFLCTFVDAYNHQLCQAKTLESIWNVFPNSNFSMPNCSVSASK